MLLFPEQVKSMRDERRNIYEKLDRLREASANREQSDFLSLNGVLSDFNDDVTYDEAVRRLDDINYTLSTSEYVTERNLGFVDLGTKFDFRDEFGTETKMLVEPGATDISFLSIDSPLGKSIKGAKSGDKVSFILDNGVKQDAFVTKIYQDTSDYEHFIRETPLSYRVKPALLNEIMIAAKNPKGIEKWHALSNSQVCILKEKSKRLAKAETDEYELRELSSYFKLPVAELPSDNSIGVGSYVTIELDANGKKHQISFEFINMARSSEIESEYVERSSQLGQAIYGLHPNDKFVFSPNLSGKVISVDNELNKTLRKVNF